ncbi:MAG: DotU family type IV/VI secretion system protein [Holosporales bacterium]|jgi:type VI secretion system protein ImpK|nr:DotU family type IV/VI secretion system protein [Holosporales bacterium]
MSFNTSDSAIVHGFQAFYYELLRCKEKALSLYSSYDASVSTQETSTGASDVTKQNGDNIEGAVVAIQKRMIKVIEDVTEVMLVESRSAPRYVGDAKYIITVLADETFLNLKWDGATFWRMTLLEKQLFQTEVAGDKFFSMADEIIVDVRNEEMAFLYLMALSLGFKGKYRGTTNSDERITWYKSRLHAMLNTKQSRLFFPGRTHMISSCYEYTHFESDDSYLPDHRFWSWCIASVVVGYIIVSYIVWCGITGEIGDLLKQISNQTKQGPLI